jgi:cytidylate kinase
MKRNLKIAIDGPAASGKSTTAKLLAKRLGYLYIDTGAMYRALTLAVLRNAIKIDDVNSIVELVDKIRLDIKQSRDGLHTYLNGEDVSEEIRLPKITEVISHISAYSEVRERMVTKQRLLAQRGGIIMDGRDIGTVVLEDADVKIFMKASLEQRSQRRFKELDKKGINVDLEEIKSEIKRRDDLDSSRSVSPLKPAYNAYIIDTSNLSVTQQVEKIIDIIYKIND